MGRAQGLKIVCVQRLDLKIKLLLYLKKKFFHDIVNVAL